MRKINLFAFTGSFFVVTLLLCISFVSCNNETKLPDGSEQFASDLNQLSNKFCQLLDGNHLTTRSGGESSPVEKAAQLDTLLQQFLSQHDITSDLSSEERRALILTENEWMRLMGDEDAFLNYLAENKTPQFQKKFDQIISGNANSITVNNIIQDSSLKLNEKLLLAMELDIVQSAPTELQRVVYSAVSPCDKRYARAVRSCQIQFATATAVAIGASIASGGVGLLTEGAAVINYFNCLDDAGNAYEDCLEDHGR